MTGTRCPCGAYAQQEPGGLRGLTCGHTLLFASVLPHDHWLSGHDRPNRIRQQALDQSFMHTSHPEDRMIAMLDRIYHAEVRA